MTIKESSVRFGTSGVRGIVSDLSNDVCQLYVDAFLQKIVPMSKRIVLGCDLRDSSPRIVKACAGAIHARGMDVLFVGALPTPALAYFALTEKIPAVMVTGSHIPFNRNGIKFYTSVGEISKEDEVAITQTVTMNRMNFIGYDPLQNLTLLSNAIALYKKRYVDFFPAYFLKGWRIGVYEHSSVARDFLSELLSEFGADVVSLGRTDAFVPIDTEAVSESDQALGQKWATEYRLDVGLLCAMYLNADSIVTPVNSTTSIERCNAFSYVARTKIGSPYVIDEMKMCLKKGLSRVVGFEANGGFLVGDPFVRHDQHLSSLPTRDAVLPMLALLAFAKEKGVKLSQLSTSLPQRFTASDRIQNFPNDSSRLLIAQLSSSNEAIQTLLGGMCGEIITRNTTDGLRLTFDSDEIVHLRPSGNAPELRCYAEANSDCRANDLVKRILGDISRLAAPL
ncbi:MAG: phosphomannomutase [Methylococcales bacterium]|nr:phosphomannomutase [Methylococcales bacterium]